MITRRGLIGFAISLIGWRPKGEAQSLGGQLRQTPDPNFPDELRRIAHRLDGIEQSLAHYPTFAPVQLAEALARETRRLATMLEERQA